MSQKGTSGLPPSRFGQLLKRVREEKGLTQKQLADTAGVHANTVARLEREEVEPSWQMVLALAKALGVDCTAFSSLSVGDEQSSAQPAGGKPEKKPAKKGKGKK